MPRIIWALMLSAIAHAALIAVPARTPGPRPDLVVFARGLPSLEVRVARVTEEKTGVRQVYLKQPTPGWKGPPEATLRPDRKSESVATREKANTSPVESSESRDTPLPAGVSLQQTLYAGPLPPGVVENPDAYMKEAELDERPVPTRLALPQYPAAAIAAGVSGWVLVAIALDEEGNVVAVSPIRASESFGEYRHDIAQAVRHSGYRPGKKDGKAVRTIVFQTLLFDAQAYARAQEESERSARKTGRNEAEAAAAGPNPVGR